MLSRFARFVCLAVLMAFASVHSAAAQTAEAVIAEASRAMGIEGLNSIRIYGSGANYTVGQNNNAEGPWPRTNLNDFTRWIDFTQLATRATATTWAVPVQGGAAARRRSTSTPGRPTSPGASTSRSGPRRGASSRARRRTARRSPRDLRRHRLQVLTWSPPQKSPGRPALQGGRLHRRRQPRALGRDLGRGPDLRRPPGRDLVRATTVTWAASRSRPRSCRAGPAGRPSRQLLDVQADPPISPSVRSRRPRSRRRAPAAPGAAPAPAPTSSRQACGGSAVRITRSRSRWLSSTG